MYQLDKKVQISSSNGERRLYPLGRYRLGSLRATRALHDALVGVEVAISESHPASDELVVSIDAELVPVTIRPLLPDGEALSFVHFYVKTSDGKSIAMMNWSPSQGELRFPVVPGPVSVTTRSAGYEDAHGSVDADGDGTVLELPMRHRTRAAKEK